MDHKVDHSFTFKIVIGMAAGILIGLLLRWIPIPSGLRAFLIDDVFRVGGAIFLNIIRMMVVPIVLVSLICGGSSLGDLKRFGRVGGKTLLLYLLTTVIAITIALFIAALFHIGSHLNLSVTDQMVTKRPPSISEVIINLFPDNPFKALSQGIMLQVIVFALLFGAALSAIGEQGKKLLEIINSVNDVLMKLITMIMRTAPYGVFCLLAALFANMGLKVVGDLAMYFGIVLLVLFIQMFGVYSLF
ncbi:MAG: cation:dicarboxylase symporter family transporter, partial [Coxiellaceae bacterium]|nr:cation:dicarboxylase symporter family transporter [Coxiellaceae bacterium]